MIACIVQLVLIVQAIQFSGDRAVRLLLHGALPRSTPLSLPRSTSPPRKELPVSTVLSTTVIRRH